jgi:hypothetical protein
LVQFNAMEMDSRKKAFQFCRSLNRVLLPLNRNDVPFFSRGRDLGYRFSLLLVVDIVMKGLNGFFFLRLVYWMEIIYAAVECCAFGGSYLPYGGTSHLHFFGSIPIGPVQPDRVIRSRVTIDSQIFSLGNRRLLWTRKIISFFRLK